MVWNFKTSDTTENCTKVIAEGNFLVKGFTLVELMVVAVIFSLVLAATFAVLTIGRRSWQISNTQIEVQQQARRAMEAIVRDLRGASAVDPATFVDGVSNGIIRFTLEGEQIEFALDQEGYDAEQLIKTAAGTSSIIADDITGIQFNLFGDNVIYITLNSQKRNIFGRLLAASLNSEVVLRN